MKRSAPLSLFTALFLLPRCLAAEDTRVCVAEFTETAPVVDGELNEPCWDKAPSCVEFHNYGQLTVPGMETILKILYGKDCMYVGVRCFQADMSEVKSDFAGPGATDRYSSRYAIEFFLKPPVNSSTCYQFVANVNDMRFDCRNAPGKWDVEWQSGFVAKAKLGNDSWTMEISVPTASLGVKETHPGDVWEFSLIRSNRSYYALWPGRENRTMLDPGGFGLLLFGGINRWWEESVRKSLAEEVKSVAESALPPDAYSRYLQDALTEELKRLDTAAPMSDDRFLSALDRVLNIKRLVSCLQSRLEWKRQLEKVQP